MIFPVESNVKSNASTVKLLIGVTFCPLAKTLTLVNPAA